MYVNQNPQKLIANEFATIIEHKTYFQFWK